MTKPRHCDCDYAKLELREEWWDRYSNAHEIEIIRCALPESPTFGYAFTAHDPMPASCSWQRVLAQQAKQATT